MIEWDKIIYDDCLNKINGLSTIPDNSIELGFVDPPFNISYYTNNKESVIYKDDMEESKYTKWCKEWFKQLKRICEIIAIHCGGMNIDMWHDIEHPYDTIYLYKINSPSGGKSTYNRTIFPVLIYGKPKNRLKRDCFEYISNWGWLRKRECLHPCPMNEQFVLDFISQLKPKSVIDPFIGSGTTAFVCKKLNIPWLGYEIDKIYSQDINNLLNEINLKESGLYYWLK
ncbi:hypothetical protein LCGC14_0795080 [marine sediment metagenome]|uniref:DNA methylase N-4/N-6 domain-containing protein n=1 Tax=marine sediment metagenome TaxID=412755 RepID=A0A0F9SBG2_9ZZZZ